RLEVLEDNADAFVLLGAVAPDVEVALRTARGAAAGALEPRVLVGGVVDDQFGDDAEVALVGLVEEGLEVVEGAVAGVDGGVVGDVVTGVGGGGGVGRRAPDGS